MAVFSDHHWSDRPAGLREMRRVARRVVLLNSDPYAAIRFWLTREYLPGFIELIPERLRQRPNGGTSFKASVGTCSSSRCRCRTTAWTASTRPTGAGPTPAGKLSNPARHRRSALGLADVDFVDDAVAAFNPTERISGQTIIRVRP
jgi:hypothetical protein